MARRVAALIQRGEAMRLDRVSRHVSLRDEAKRLNLTPMQLSNLENARD